MFEASRLLFLYVETPLHAGTGRGLGAVDLPIQRERTTNYPIVQASSLKGRIRAEAREEVGKGNLSREEFIAIFGADTPEEASSYPGAVSFGDARILLFPVRSLAGVFAWTTSVEVLERLKRTAQIAGMDFEPEIPSEPENGAFVCGNTLKAGESVVLEEYSLAFNDTHTQVVKEIANWILKYAFPTSKEYDYWRKSLPERLCIVPNNLFRDFTVLATEIQTHIKLDPQKKTVQSGALWTVESVPVDTLFYAPVMATKTRSPSLKPDLSAKEVLERVVGLGLQRIQLGGDETTGQGLVALRFSNGGEK